MATPTFIIVFCNYLEARAHILTDIFNVCWIRPDPDLDLNYPDLIFMNYPDPDPDPSDPDSIPTAPRW